MPMPKILILVRRDISATDARDLTGRTLSEARIRVQELDVEHLDRGTFVRIVPELLRDIPTIERLVRPVLGDHVAPAADDDDFDLEDKPMDESELAERTREQFGRLAETQQRPNPSPDTVEL